MENIGCLSNNFNQIDTKIVLQMQSSEAQFLLTSQQFMSTLLQKSQSHSPDLAKTSYRKVHSTQKSSPLRQTVQMKHKKFHKINYESKQLTVGKYQDNFFAIEPTKQANQGSPQRHIITNRMKPVTNTWVTNSKRVQSKWALEKRVSHYEDSPIKFRLCNDQQFCEEMPYELKDYIHSVKHYYKQHQRKVDSQRRIKVKMMKQIKANLQGEDGNLNIIKLKPSSQQHHLKRRQTMETGKQTPHRSPNKIHQYNSTNHLEKDSSPTKSEIEHGKAKTSYGSRVSEKLFRRKASTVKKEYHYIFGDYRNFMPEEAVLQLKTMYYRDFLWKISFNRTFILQSSETIHRYYVGKGNNSRLIRRLMNKRGWWVEEKKQQNAHFLWTQLKVYEAYKGQRIEKQQKKSQKLLICQSETIGQSRLLMAASEILGLQKQAVKPNLLKTSSEDKNKYILNESKYEEWRRHIEKKGGFERKPYEDMRQRSNLKPQVKKVTHKVTNHLEFSRVIGNKKALYRTMQAFFTSKGVQDWYIPLTFHITGGIQNQQYLTFLRQFYKKSKEGLNWWIVKPGELSNRGKDIKFCSSLQSIKQVIKQKKMNPNGSPRTYIVQSYIHKPFLYQGRKFDLRHYLMVTSTEGVIRGYFYQQGYVRTTSYPYSLENPQSGVHLTNDAVQKYLPNYSKFQKANKLSYQQLNQYMLKKNPQKGFYTTIFPQLRQIGSDVIQASFPFIDPQRRANNFQIFGIDVMIDQNCKCWLIQVNTNPCIEVNCPVLASVVPSMLDNALTIGLDALVDPPLGKPKVVHNNYLLQNKFELVFDQATQGHLYDYENIDIGNYGDDDDNYESCEEDDYQL